MNSLSLRAGRQGEEGVGVRGADGGGLVGGRYDEAKGELVCNVA